MRRSTLGGSGPEQEGTGLKSDSSGLKHGLRFLVLTTLLRKLRVATTLSWLPTRGTDAESPPQGGLGTPSEWDAEDAQRQVLRAMFMYIYICIYMYI